MGFRLPPHKHECWRYTIDIAYCWCHFYCSPCHHCYRYLQGPHIHCQSFTWFWVNCGRYIRFHIDPCTRVLRKASVPKARSSRNAFPHLLGHSWNTQKQFHYCGFSNFLALLTSIRYTLSWGLQVPHTRWPLPHWKIFVGGPIGSKHTLKVKSDWSHVTFAGFHRTIWHQRRWRS